MVKIFMNIDFFGKKEERKSNFPISKSKIQNSFFFFPISQVFFPFFVSSRWNSWLALQLIQIFNRMAGKPTTNNKMRIYHRYLGYFLAGIMAVYAISGVVMIFRDTDIFKKKKQVEQQLAAGLNAADLGKALRIRDLQFESEKGDIAFFKQGTYNKSTGVANYTVTSLPLVLDKLTRLHKANTKQPLYYLNVFFGVSLLFFVISSFWMFLPKTSIFRKGLYFTLGGLILTLVLLFV